MSFIERVKSSNSNTNNVTEMRGMFWGCSEQFQNKIKVQYKNIKEEVFN